MPAKLTNKHNIPEHIYQAIIVDDHVTNGDISVTTLIDAPQIRYLKMHHDYEMDAMDLIAAFLGTGMHTALERAEKGKYKERILKQAAGVLRELGEDKAADYLKKIVVEKFDAKYEDDIYLREINFTIIINGWQISGTIDLYNKITCEIEDYKQTSAAAYMYPEFKKLWDAQMNCYAVILRHNGYEVKGARIHAFFKDWSKMKIMTSKDYPKTPYLPITIRLIDNDQVVDYMTKRVIIHQKASSGVQIDCTGKDRWASSPVYAVMKKGGKRSHGNRDTEKNALAYIEQIEHKHPPGSLFVQYRPGLSKRCEEYCPVKDFCPQYKRELESMTKDSEEMVVEE